MPADKIRDVLKVTVHVGVVQMVDLLGSAIDDDVELTNERSGEAEGDALPVRQAHLLADDVSDRALHLGQGDLGRDAGVVGYAAERGRDVAFVTQKSKTRIARNRP